MLMIGNIVDNLNGKRVIIVILVVLVLIFLGVFFWGFYEGGEKDVLSGRVIGVMGEVLCSAGEDFVYPEEIIPRPQNVEMLSCDSIVIDSGWKIYADLSGNDNFSAEYLKSEVLNRVGLDLGVGDIEEMQEDIVNIEMCSRVDLDDDGDVDNVDFFIIRDSPEFSNSYSNCSASSWCSGFDINHDGMVDPIDAGIVADSEVGTCSEDVKIIIGNPNKNSVLAEIAEEKGIDVNFSQGFNQGYVLFMDGDEILIFANSSVGSFYGMISLVWMLEDNGSDVILPNVKITDWPDLNIRGFYGGGTFLWDGETIYTNNQAEKWIDILTMYKYNLWLSGLTAISTTSQYNIDALLGREKFLRDRHFFTSMTLNPAYVTSNNSNLYEGIFVENVSLRFNSSDIAEVIEGESIVLNNSDFELDEDSNGFPDNWYMTSNNSDSYWAIDCTTSASGSCSAKLYQGYDLPLAISSAALKYGKNYLSRDLFIEPNSVYQFSVWAKKNTIVDKSQTQVTFGLVDENEKDISSSSVGFEGNNNTWQKYTNLFTTYNGEKKIYLYSRAQSTDALELWIDDFEIEKISDKLINILETNDTEVRVWNSNKSVQYVRDIDYYLEEIGEVNASFPLDGKQTIIHRIDFGNILPNSGILVDYDFLPKMQPERTESNSFADSEVYRIYNENSLRKNLVYVQPDFVFLGLDEVRGFNRDSRSKKLNMTNYELFAYYVNNLTSMIHSYDSNIKVLMWDDMISPFHNGNREYQVQFGGQFGKTWYSLDLIDRSVILIPWWYGNDYNKKMRITPALYGLYGFEYFGAPSKNDTNIRQWSYLSYENDALGIIDHEFYDDVSMLNVSANYSWNSITTYEDGCNSDSLEICDGVDNDCDDLYDLSSWQVASWGSDVDEGFNLTEDVFNCGSCGNICYYSKGFANCVSGVCQFDGCYEGYFDANNNFGDGCECVIVNSGIEICNDLDDDCDGGVDEGLDCLDYVPDSGSSSGGGGGFSNLIASIGLGVSQFIEGVGEIFIAPGVDIDVNAEFVDESDYQAMMLKEKVRLKENRDFLVSVLLSLFSVFLMVWVIVYYFVKRRDSYRIRVVREMNMRDEHFAYVDGVLRR